MVKRLTPTQINALRLAAKKPSRLKIRQFYIPTETALERMGLIERDGGSFNDQGAGSASWLITAAGRKALKESE